MTQANTNNKEFGAITNPKQYRKEMVDWLNQQGFNFFVTLNLNLKNASVQTGSNKLKKFHGYLDRALLGKHWHRKPDDERTLFIAFPEHLKSNLHYHLLVKVKEDKKMDFRIEAPKAWGKVATSGSIEIGNSVNGPILDSDVDSIKVAWYSTKNVWNDDCRENFVISSQFINSSAS